LDNFKQFTFRDAARLWLDSRKSISPRTRIDYQQYLRALMPHFGELRLEQIDSIELVNRYREARQKTTGPMRINHELNALSQILRRAGVWAKIADWYEPLPVPRHGPGRALSAEQQEHLLNVASSKARWRVVYWAATVMANTALGWGELRHLHLRDVDLERRTITVVEGTKNEYRVRTLPLNEPAFWALRKIMVRARAKGVRLPEHYIFPHRSGPERPMVSIYTAWYALREAAGLPGFRIYDLRHTALTRALEDPQAPLETIRQIAGHISKRQIETYSHIALESKRAVLDRLAVKAPRLRIVEKLSKTRP